MLTLERTGAELWQTADGTIQAVSADDYDPLAACAGLESGGILYFPKSPFTLSEMDLDFLLSQRQESSVLHKNVSYKPAQDKLSGVQTRETEDVLRLKRIMKQYSEMTVDFIGQYLTPYAAHYRLDYASFRPIEEENRQLRLRARNDLLHVDSFPTRPVKGNRILRVFYNIHPTKERIWRTSDTFESLAQTFYTTLKPYQLHQKSAYPQWFSALCKQLGARDPNRPAYDRWMLDFHNFLKENTLFQDQWRKLAWSFPPGSAWVVYTDMVSHAVLSGQHALEQTFIIDQRGLVLPHKAPINILTQLASA